MREKEKKGTDKVWLLAKTVEFTALYASSGRKVS